MIHSLPPAPFRRPSSIPGPGASRLSASVLLAGAFALGLACATAAAAADEPLAVTSGQAMPQSAVPVYQTPAVDAAALLARADARRKPDVPAPLEYAQPFEVNLTPSNSGVWEVVDLGRKGRFWLWRLQVESPGAASVNLGFTRYQLPPGASLSIYAPEYKAGGSREQVRYFTDADNEDHGQLWVPLLRGQRIIVELAVPEARRADVRLKLGWINGGFREIGAVIKSGSCNVDVVCSQGDAFRDQIRAVGVMSLNGSRLCSGSAINNTGGRRPLFITANHCGLRANNAATLVVFWNFQNSTCRPVGSGSSGGPGNGSLAQFNSGARFLATSATSDFTLAELDDDPLPAFNVFLEGWDRRPGPFNDGAVGIHHPGVDEKRISIANRATEDDNGTHHKIWWRPNGIGVTEPGSSGSPIYSKQGRFIGQLTGGGSACGAGDADMWDVYGKLSRSWDGDGTPSTRARDHLDPVGSAPQMIDGRNWNDGPQPSPSPSPAPSPSPSPSPSPAPGTNLALNKPATSSTPCNGDEGPAKAVNGSVSGGNSDKWCSTTAPRFLQVDLGASFSLTTFIVRHAGAGGESTAWNTRDFNIQVSANGTSFTTVATVTGNTADVTTHTIAATAARFVRLNVVTPTSDGDGAARIYEFEAYGAGPTPSPSPSPAPGANLALNKPATGSTPCNANEGPAKAVNGSVSGGLTDKWCSSTAPRFLQVDLGGSFSVVRFVVKHAEAGGESATFNTRNFNIQVSTNGTTFTTVATVAGNTAAVSTHDVAAASARFVRLNVTQATQSGTGGAARIYEFEVYGVGPTPSPSPGPSPSPSPGVPPPPASWQEHWFEHNQNLGLVGFDDHAAVYLDPDVDQGQRDWILDFVSRTWVYFKQTYGSFGPDPRLHSIHHQNKYFGGHPGDRFSDLHDFRNSSDIGIGDNWQPTGGNRDLISHEICHVIESASRDVHGSPAFPIWGDSKWAEICQYDLYLALGLQADADRVFQRFDSGQDDFPRPGTRWFRNWFFPIWRDHGRSQVMPRYFALLAQHFPKHTANHGNGSHLDYDRDLNLGEFIHFMSGAAGTNLSSQATTAFGTGWEGQFQQARNNFPGVTY